MHLHHHQKLADYQAMYAKIADCFAHRLPAHSIIDDAKNQPIVFKDCYKRFLIDCIYAKHRIVRSPTPNNMLGTSFQLSLHTLSLCWQQIMALESTLHTTPNINIALNLCVLLAKLADTLSMETTHATC